MIYRGHRYIDPSLVCPGDGISACPTNLWGHFPFRSFPLPTAGLFKRKQLDDDKGLRLCLGVGLVSLLRLGAFVTV